MLKRSALVTVAIAICTLAQPAHAQPRARHDKLNLAFGVGTGSLNTSCETCNYIAKERGNLITVRAGWTLHDLAIVAAEGTLLRRSVASGHDDRPIETSFQALTVSLFGYFGKHSDAFIKFGGGMSRGKRNVQLTTDTLRSYVEVTSPVVRFGAGIDLRIGRTWSVTPVIEYLAAVARTSDEISFVPLDKRTAPGVKTRNKMLVFGLGLTFP